MKKLNRASESQIAGVCEGLGNYFGIDGIIFRLLFCALIFTPFPSILSYILFWIIIPKEKTKTEI
jgi:phage shock protein C